MEVNIPNFADAVGEFQDFLAEEGHNGSIEWVFLDDIFMPNAKVFFLRHPPPGRNSELAEKVFEEGRRRGLVEIAALARFEQSVAATIWFPKYKAEEVQGWNQGLRLTHRRPLPQAKLVRSSVEWWIHQLKPGYRRFQKYSHFIGTREWAAA